MKKIGNMLVSELGLESDLHIGRVKYFELLGLSCCFITSYLSIYMGSIGRKTKIFDNLRSCFCRRKVQRFFWKGVD